MKQGKKYTNNKTDREMARRSKRRKRRRTEGAGLRNNECGAWRRNKRRSGRIGGEREEITGEKDKREGGREGADEEIKSLTPNYASSFLVFITRGLVQLHLIHTSV